MLKPYAIIAICFIQTLVFVPIVCARPELNNSSTVINNNNNTKLNDNVTITSEKNATTNKNIVLTEGGKISNLEVNINKKTIEHMGREGVVISTKAPVKINSSIAAPSSTTKTIPVHEKLDDNVKTKPRKGVNPEDYQSTPLLNVSSTTPKPNTTVSSTTIKVITERAKKPTITIGGDDDENIIKSSIKQNNSKDITNVPSIEYITESKKHRSTDYVVPIVAVILSVPLVAILISVLYKRSSEWWQHRHYRRMDFLIEGMYNN